MNEKEIMSLFIEIAVNMLKDYMTSKEVKHTQKMKTELLYQQESAKLQGNSWHTTANWKMNLISSKL